MNYRQKKKLKKLMEIRELQNKINQRYDDAHTEEGYLDPTAYHAMKALERKGHGKTMG